MNTVYRPFKTRPEVRIVSTVDVYKLVAALTLPVPRAARGRRELALALIAHSLAGVRRGSESAEAWAARAQKQINDIARNITDT